MNSAANTSAADRIELIIAQPTTGRAKSLRLIDVAFEKGKINQVESRRLEQIADWIWPA